MIKVIEVFPDGTPGNTLWGTTVDEQPIPRVGDYITQGYHGFYKVTAVIFDYDLGKVKEVAIFVVKATKMSFV